MNALVLLTFAFLAQAQKPQSFNEVMGDTCAYLKKQQQANVTDLPKSQNLCELTRDNNRSYAEKELKWYGCDKAEFSQTKACQEPRRTIANLNGEYQKCKAERAKQEQQLADQGRNVEKLCKDQQLNAKNAALTAQNEARAAQAAKFQAEFDKQQDQIRETNAAIQKMADAMRSAQRDLEAGREQHDEAMERMRQSVDEGVKDITYKPQSGEDAQKLAAAGGPSQSVDDLLNEPPEQPQREGEYSTQITFDAADPQCGDGMRKVFFSCRVPNRPPNAQSCEELNTQGQGATCLGMTACCVNIREQRLIYDATKDCPIVRSSFELAGGKKDPFPAGTCKPIPKEDWPSVRSCVKPVRLAAPAGPDHLWSDAECNAYLKQVNDISAVAAKLHINDAALRKEWQSAGDPMKCPHACGHGPQFLGVADQFERQKKWIDAEVGKELQRKKGCDVHLKQADLEATYLSWHIKHLASFITDWNPDKDDDRGPYYDWTVAGDTRIYNGNQGAQLCGALADYWNCLKQ